MAFKLKQSRDYVIPQYDDGIYLFPFGWFMYGYKKGFITISDPMKFNNSLQGSAIQQLCDNVSFTELSPEEIFDNFGFEWILIESGKDVANVVTANGELVYTHSKIGELEMHSLYDMRRASLQDQERWNHQYIACFPGCGIKLKQRKAWFVTQEQLRLM